MTHELKCVPPYFQDVLDGHKTFEFRANDRGFAVGDVLVLKEWEPDTRTYTGRETSQWVTYFFDGFGLRSSGYCVLGIIPAGGGA